MTQRLVALGMKRAATHTVDIRIDNRFGAQREVVAAGLLQWSPAPAPGPKHRKVIDHDLLRKQRIESREDEL